jgi:hypothetical protein
MSDGIAVLLDIPGSDEAAGSSISPSRMVAAEMTLDHPERVSSAIQGATPSGSDRFRGVRQDRGGKGSNLPGTVDRLIIRQAG